MAVVLLDGKWIRSPEEFYAAFFEHTAHLIPDFGGRNLDALVDDLRELE
jgi:RNAse (barnase) inhibitor barstar